MGSFSCWLDFTNAPKTVANFVGLATGQRAWLDLPSGRAKTNAFYNGLTFHRVIAGFMIQGGSPNGNGTDGPGYAFLDEFSPALVFTNYGVMAMANSGTNSNGAQFFITVEPFTSGNNTYAIFGKLVSGSNVVYAINHVATGANDKPLTNVVMQQVTIRRVGAAAQAFNVNAYSLPVVTNLPLKISNSGTQVSLTFSNRLYADNRLYSGTNLTNRSANLLGIEISSPFTNIVYWAKDAPTRFFSMAEVQYASSTFAPKTLYNRTLTLVFTSGASGNITNVFDSAGTGTYNYSGSGPGTITSYSWTQDVYRGNLYPIQYSGLYTMTFQLNFTGNNGGIFNGTVYSSTPFGVAGTFTLN